MGNHWNEDEDDELDEGNEEYVEQVCDVLCPHCRRPLQLVLASADDEDEELDEDDEE